MQELSGASKIQGQHQKDKRHLSEKMANTDGPIVILQ